MTTDRLREAAEWFQSEADWARSLGLGWEDDAALAALLRAIEAEVRLNPTHDTRTASAALAFADLVLGGES